MQGEYRGTVDSKRRLSLPRKLRENLGIDKKGRSLHLARGLDGCLWLLTPSQWNELENGLGDLRRENYGFGSKQTRAFLREFYRRSAELTMDSHGRISLPESLMGLVGIEKDVILIVMPERTELWSADAEPTCDDYDETAEKLFG